MLEVNITNRKVFSQYYNGETFNTNLTDFMPHLYGSVMNKVKVVHTLTVGWSSQSSNTEKFSYDSTQSRITRPFGSFIEDGFSTGDTITVLGFTTIAPSVPFGFTAVIGSMTAGSLFLNTIAGTVPANGEQEVTTIIGTTSINSLQLQFGMPENTENVSYNNKVDTSVQAYYLDNITGVFQDMIPQGTKKSWINGVARVRKLANIGTYQQFEVENEFLITPYYLDGELDNLLTLSEPTLFQGINSLKYVTKYEFRTLLANSNTSKILEDSQLLGDNGWFNENYNGFNNRFSVSNHNGVALVPNNSTVVEFDVDSIINSFDLNSKVGVYFSYLPIQDEYLANTNYFNDIWDYDARFGGIGTTNFVGIIEQIEVTLVSPTKLHVKATIKAPAGFDLNDYYLIGCEVASSGLNNTNSDRVLLLTDVRAFNQSLDEPNLFEVTELLFQGHPNTNDYTDYKGWVEDGILVNGKFWLDTALNPLLNSFNINLVAYNNTTDESFIIDSTNFVLTPNLLISGAQIFNIDTTQGFKLNSTEPKNYKYLKNSTLVGTKQYYDFKLGVKIDWQEWLALVDVPSIFYDTTQDNDGFNHLASNYFANNYTIRVVVDALVNNTDYRTVSNTLEIYEYDKDGSTPAGYSGAIKTYTSVGGLDITPLILDNKDTYVEATFTKDPTNTCVAIDFWGILRLEEANNVSKQNIYELSSVFGTVANSPLKSTLGSGLLEIVPSGSTVTLKGYVDYLKLKEGINYKLSARLGCECADVPPPIGRITSNYTGLTNMGDFTGTFQIREGDDVTPLQLGDEVTLTFITEDTNTFIGEGVFAYGVDLSTTTPITDNGFVSNVQPFIAAGSLVQNGGSYTILKKPLTHTFTANNVGSQVAGINKGEALRIEIRVKDTSTGLTSTNVDNTTSLQKLFNSIMTGGSGTVGGSPVQELIYMIVSRDLAIRTAIPATIQVNLNGTTTTETCINTPGFYGAAGQPNITGYQDRIVTGSTRLSPFGFSELQTLLPHEPALTMELRYQKDGANRVALQSLILLTNENETAKTYTILTGRTFTVFATWGNFTAHTLRIATSPGADPMVNFTEYVLPATIGAGSTGNVVHTFTTEGIYDMIERMITTAGTQPASYLEAQMIVYSY